jgi:dipeptide/tripeptide permease
LYTYKSKFWKLIIKGGSIVNNKKRLSLNPLWIIAFGAVCLAITYSIGNSNALVTTTLKIAGIMMLIFGIILGSAKMNSRRKL